jgi:predicted CopG family antitoxin
VNIRSRATIAALVLAIAGLALPAVASATREAGRVNDTSDVISRYLRNRANDTSDVVSRYVSNRTTDRSDVVSRYLRNRSGAQASKPKPEVTPAVQMARHFQHEDALYAARPVTGQTRTPAQAMALHFQHEDALYRASAPTSSPSALAAQVATSHGFDWNDALIGAGIALAIVLLLSATGIGVVRHRHSHLKSA